MKRAKPRLIEMGYSVALCGRSRCRPAVLALSVALGCAAPRPAPCAVSQGQLYAAASAAAQRKEYARAEQLLTARLSRHPEDLQSLALRARVRSWSRRWAGALSDYDKLLKAEPGNADYLLGKAQVLLWSGSAHAAATVAQTGRKLAPAYQALWKVELQALLASGDDTDRRAAVALAREASRRFPASTWPVPVRSEPQPYFEIAATAGRERLSNGFADWSSDSVEADYHFGKRRVVYGSVKTTERFGFRDTAVDAGVSLPIGARWVGTADLSVGPNANVLPERSIAFGGTRVLPRGWNVGVNVRHSRYRGTYADLTSASVGRYWRDYRFAYTVYRSDTAGAPPSLSHALRVDYYYDDASSVGLSLAHGRELESVGGGRLLDTTVTAAALLGQQRLSPNWKLTWSATHHRQGTVYQRDGLYVGFKRRF